MPRSIMIVGEGRAGGSFATALRRVGWRVRVVHHDGPGDPSPEDPDGAADLVLLCVPDAAVPSTAASLAPNRSRVVAHCSGSLGLDALRGHPRTASVHPVVALPDPVTGADRLVDAWFAVAGDPLAREVVEALGGTAVEVSDDARARHHAAAVVASNHLVALLGQVERLAARAGVPLEAYLALAAASLQNVVELGPAAALTGPVARGDWDTVERHLGAMESAERPAYLALASEAARLAGRELPPGLSEETSR